MAKLNDQHRTLIVTEFAAFKTAGQIVELLKADFGVDADLHQVLFYHPEKTTGGKGKRLGKKWRELFKTARAQFLGSTSSIGLAHPSYRLGVLQRQLDRELEKPVPAHGRVTDLVERGAKEVGGFYTNRRELTGKGGGPIETAAMTLDQWRDSAAARRAQAEEAVANFGGDA